MHSEDKDQLLGYKLYKLLCLSSTTLQLLHSCFHTKSFILQTNCIDLSTLHCKMSDSELSGEEVHLWLMLDFPEIVIIVP